jgi:hypothetical protein
MRLDALFDMENPLAARDRKWSEDEHSIEFFHIKKA